MSQISEFSFGNLSFSSATQGTFEFQQNASKYNGRNNWNQNYMSQETAGSCHEGNSQPVTGAKKENSQTLRKQKKLTQLEQKIKEVREKIVRLHKEQFQDHIDDPVEVLGAASPQEPGEASLSDKTKIRNPSIPNKENVHEDAEVESLATATSVLKELPDSEDTTNEQRVHRRKKRNICQAHLRIKNSQSALKSFQPPRITPCNHNSSNTRRNGGAKPKERRLEEPSTGVIQDRQKELEPTLRKEVSTSTKSNQRLQASSAVSREFNLPTRMLSTPSFEADPSDILRVAERENFEEWQPVQLDKSKKSKAQIPGPIGEMYRRKKNDPASTSESQPIIVDPLSTQVSKSYKDNRPWREMLMRFKKDEKFQQNNISKILVSGSFTCEFLAAKLDRIEQLESGGFGVLSDLSGRIEAELHEEALDAYPLSLVEGSVLVLQNVTIFRPVVLYDGASPSVIILERNIKEIFADKPEFDIREEKERASLARCIQVGDWIHESASSNDHGKASPVQISDEEVNDIDNSVHHIGVESSTSAAIGEFEHKQVVEANSKKDLPAGPDLIQEEIESNKVQINHQVTRNQNLNEIGLNDTATKDAKPMHSSLDYSGWSDEDDTELENAFL